jgi:RND superfamily putative drug exporter
LLWVVLLVGAGVLAGRAPAAPPNDFSMPGTEAQQAYDLLERDFPELKADGATARVVFRAEDGKVTDPQTRRAIGETVRALGDDPQVARVTDPFTTRSVSKDGSTAYAQVSYEVSASKLEDGSRTALRDTVERAASPELSVEAGGNAVEAKGAGHSSEAVGLAVAAVVLVLTFGSLLAAGLAADRRARRRLGRAGHPGAGRTAGPRLHDDQPRRDDRTGRGHRLRPVRGFPLPGRIRARTRS